MASDWVQVVSTIFTAIGCIGGIGGIISIYHAKSNKDTIDLGNMQTMLDEAQDEREQLKTEYSDYMSRVDKKIDNLHDEVFKQRDEVLKIKKSIYSAYRCSYPDKVETDCPVIKAYSLIKEKMPASELSGSIESDKQ